MRIGDRGKSGHEMIDLFGLHDEYPEERGERKDGGMMRVLELEMKEKK